MRPFLYIVSFLAVMFLAFWAYRENYTTQNMLKDVSSLNRQIADLRTRLAMQNAEWA
ncbi:cell division protein FtsL, partial [Xanthomonas citri pv. citri]|nr:cell division protein FtsL [Xanthomonas citri pv. citri]